MIEVDDAWLKKYRKASQEVREVMKAQMDAVDTEEKALRELDGHSLVEQVHKAIEKAAKETGTSVEDVRLAEVRRYVDDVPEYEKNVSESSEQWKKDNATHCNPKNPANTWYSVDGSGNPAGWIKKAIGTKPDKNKEPEQYEAYLKKLAGFKVKTQVTDKAA